MCPSVPSVPAATTRQTQLGTSSSSAVGRHDELQPVCPPHLANLCGVAAPDPAGATHPAAATADPAADPAAAADARHVQLQHGASHHHHLAGLLCEQPRGAEPE